MPTFELNRLLSYDDEALLAELRRVAALIDSPFVTKSAFDYLSKASYSTIQKRFGGWKEALTRAGLADRHSGATGGVGKKRRVFTDDELVAELCDVSRKLDGKPVTKKLFDEYASMNAMTLIRRFGSWSNALRKAGLTISNLGRRYSDDDYFENLLAVWTHHGRQPKYREMDSPPSSIPSGAYEAKWGKWTEALLAFLKRVNSDIRPDEPAKLESAIAAPVEYLPSRKLGGNARTPRSKDEDRHEIKLGLRYEVLKRDRFRCVLCGASPATHLGCVLHVDHLLPFSKSGKTVAENLRSLCEPCNLGKSAKLES
jgi:hypothetical protein